MRVILCYGDSNTHGYNAATQARFAPNVRWTGVLARELGSDYQIIEEGLGGRTTVWDDPIEGDKNGKTYLTPCLYSHEPIDLVVIALGSNDLKKRFSLSPFDVAAGAATLVRLVQTSTAGPGGRAPQILLISPPRITSICDDYSEMFEGAIEKSIGLIRHFERNARELGVALLDAGDIVTCDPLDGIHLTAEEHAKMGRALAAKLREIFQPQ